MSDRIDTELALRALHMAVEQRQPNAGCVHHTDRDSRYASALYQAHLRHHGLIPSMSRKGDCWDNAVAESFFATLEKELLADVPLKKRTETRNDISDYIDHYYNVKRRHSYLDYDTPVAYELAAA